MKKFVNYYLEEKIFKIENDKAGITLSEIEEGNKEARWINNHSIIDVLANFVAGMNLDFSVFGKNEEIEEEILVEFYSYEREWNDLECDPEGFTKEQQSIADDLDLEYEKIIENLLLQN